MENTNYHDFLNMCRTCMLDIDLKPIEDALIIEILEFITENSFKRNDELPQQICGTCIKKLLEINNFLKQSRLSEDTFKKYLTNFKNECPGATIDPGTRPMEIYVLEPPEIKKEKESSPEPETEQVINFDSIIKDMRKEFDVLPTDPLTVKVKEEPVATSIDVIKHTCQTCGKTYASQYRLKRHMPIHSPNNPHKCKMCQKEFSEALPLAKHEQMHSGIRHGCDVCNKHFIDVSDLKRHKRTHSELKPFNCDVCNKLFYDHNGLEKHQRAHSKLTSHKCDICRKEFRTYSQLKEHKYIHNEKEDYKCEVCGKLFRSTLHLRRHVRNHINVK